jgi:hypothetical protein
MDVNDNSSDGSNDLCSSEITSTWIDMDTSVSNKVTEEQTIQPTTTTTTTHEMISHLPGQQQQQLEKNKNNKINEPRTNMKNNPSKFRWIFFSKEYFEIPLLVKDSFDYSSIPDEVFSQLLAKAFDEDLDFIRFSNKDQMIKFIRYYTSLIDRLSHLQSQEVQWKYYYHIGMTQNIWEGHMDKHLAEKYSIVPTYGRSKTLIEQRLKETEKHLQQIADAVQQSHEQFRASRWYTWSDKLLLTVGEFVNEKQKPMEHEFRYEREILLLDATDHQLVQKFFDLKPDKSQVRN